MADTYTDDEISAEALRTLIDVMRKPDRHAMARVSAARNALDFTKSKPAQRTEVSGVDGEPIATEHRIVFVEPEK